MNNKNSLETEVTIELKQERAANKLLNDMVEYKNKSSKRKDVIIVILILCMLVEALGFYAGFVWYESQFDTTTTGTAEVYTEGDNANAEYNSVQGNQYNDSSTHNE